MIIDERSKHYTSCAFERKLYWDIDNLLKGSPCKTGYLLQRINRRLDACSLFKAQHENWEEYNHEYFEAWIINNGQIVYKDPNGKVIIDKKDIDYDDCWNHYCDNVTWMMNEYLHSYGTEGKTVMSGVLYWCPIGSSVFNEIHKNFRVGNVKFARRLLSAWKMKELPGVPIYTHGFCHEWNLKIDKRTFIQHIVKEQGNNIRSDKDIEKYVRSVFKGEEYCDELCDAMKRNMDARD